LDFVLEKRVELANAAQAKISAAKMMRKKWVSAERFVIFPVAASAVPLGVNL